MTDIVIHLRADASQLDRQLRASAVGFEKYSRLIERGFGRAMRDIDRDLKTFSKDARDAASTMAYMAGKVDIVTRSAAKLSTVRGPAALANSLRASNQQLAVMEQRTRRVASHLHGGNLHIGPGGIGIGGLGIGMGAAGVPLALGAAGIGMAATSYRSASDYQLARARFRVMNLGDKANAEAEDYARNKQIFGVSQTEKMDTLRESVGLFGGMEHAKPLIPIIAQLNKANAALYGGKVDSIDEGSVHSLMRFIDRRGGTHDTATFTRTLDLAQKMVNASGGFINFRDLEQFSQYGGTAFRGLSDEGLINMSGLMQEQGGGKAGQAMMSVYQNLIAGRATKKSLVNLQELGLGTMAYQTHAQVGGKPFKTMVMKDLVGKDQLQADPVGWVREVLLPALQKKGITDPGKQLQVVNDFLSNRTASGQQGIMTTQQLQLMRDANLTRGSKGAQATIDEWKQTGAGAEAQFLAAWSDFKNVFGTEILPGATKMLLYGSDLLRVAKGSEVAAAGAGGMAAATAAGLTMSRSAAGAGGSLSGFAKFGRFARFGAGLGSVVELGMGGKEMWDTYHNNQLTDSEKKIAYTGTVGSMGGAIAGMAAGAAIGSIVPVLGTAIGAALGGAIGGMGGAALGRWGGTELGQKWFGTGQPTPGQEVLNPAPQLEAAVNKGMVDAIKATPQAVELTVKAHMSYDKPPTLEFGSPSTSTKLKTDVGVTMRP